MTHEEFTAKLTAAFGGDFTAFPNTAIITVPEGWTTEQIYQFKQWWDAATNKREIIFIPHGLESLPVAPFFEHLVRAIESLAHDTPERWRARLEVRFAREALKF